MAKTYGKGTKRKSVQSKAGQTGRRTSTKSTERTHSKAKQRKRV